MYTFHLDREQWYLFILDIIDTKLLKEKPASPKKKPPENICTIKFLNKGMEHIQISEIMSLPDIIQSLPDANFFFVNREMTPKRGNDS